MTESNISTTTATESTESKAVPETKSVKPTKIKAVKAILSADSEQAEKSLKFEDASAKAFEDVRLPQCIEAHADLATMARAVVGCKKDQQKVLTRLLRRTIQLSGEQKADLLNPLIKAYRYAKKDTTRTSEIAKWITDYCRVYLALDYDEKTRTFADIQPSQVRDLVWFMSPKNPSAPLVGDVKHTGKQYATPKALLDLKGHDAKTNFLKVLTEVRSAYIKKVDAEKACDNPDMEAIKACMGMLELLGLVESNVEKQA